MTGSTHLGARQEPRGPLTLDLALPSLRRVTHSPKFPRSHDSDSGLAARLSNQAGTSIA